MADMTAVGFVTEVDGRRELIAGLVQEAEDLAAAAAFRAERCAIQHAQTERLAQRLPLDQIRLPFVFRSEIGIAEIEMLADAFTAGLATL